MHFVGAASYVSAYKLLLTFEDGSHRLVDLEPHLDGEIFEPLKDISYFRRVRVDPVLSLPLLLHLLLNPLQGRIP